MASADGEASRTAAAARKARGLGMEGGAVWACGVWRERGERRKEGEVERERGGGRGGGSGGGGGAREERAGRAARLGPTRSNCHPSRSRWSPLDATPRGALSAKGGAHAESTLRARRSLSSIVRLSVFSSLPSLCSRPHSPPPAERCRACSAGTGCACDQRPPGWNARGRRTAGGRVVSCPPKRLAVDSRPPPPYPEAELLSVPSLSLLSLHTHQPWPGRPGGTGRRARRRSLVLSVRARGDRERLGV